jgi:sugar lactone lactonase YvrE
LRNPSGRAIQLQLYGAEFYLSARRIAYSPAARPPSIDVHRNTTPETHEEKLLKNVCILSITALALCGIAQAGGQQPYKVLDHWKIGGTGSWDYLTCDSAAHLLYLAHGPRVEVIDTQTGKPVTAIAGLKGTHGIALDNHGKFGYISDGGGNSVVVFDRHGFAVVTTIPAGTNPDGIVFEPSTQTVWAFNGRSKNATVIDAATNQVVATVDLPGKPEFPVADGPGAIFDPIENLNELVRFDAAGRKLTATWKLNNCESPSGLALDAIHRQLFAVCDGKKMAVVNADSGQQLASPAIGDSPDAAAVSPSRQLAFSSNGGGGTLTVIDAAHAFKVLETLPTAPGGRTMAYDEAADRIFVAAATLGPPPPATAQTPHPRASIVPDSYEVIVIGRP